IQVNPKQGEPILLTVSLRTGSKPPALKVAWFTNEDARPRAFPLRRFLVPWAPTGPAATAEVAQEIPQLKGGDWARGRQVFVGDHTGQEHVVAQVDVESLMPLRTSIMPEGLDKSLGPDKLRDLLTFLLTPPLSPAPLLREGAPPPRTKAELDAVLSGSQPLAG